MFTFVKLGKRRINLDNIDYIEEGEIQGQPKIWIYYPNSCLSIVGEDAIKLLHIVDVRALGRSVPIVEGE